jgi:thymidylate synthase
MENFVKQAENKISDMKSQLEEMKEIQNHPIKTALKNTIKALETKVAAIKEQIGELKANIIEGCKNAVAAFKEKGISALDKLASFFRVKTCLEKMKTSTVAAVKECDKSVAKIETFSKQYHTAGRAVKNMLRMVVGKEPIDAVKESGKLAKVMCAPARAEKACMLGIHKSCNSMLEKLEQLNQRADAKREEKATGGDKGEKPAAITKKPTLMERLEEKKELVRQLDLERAVPGRGTITKEAAL